MEYMQTGKNLLREHVKQAGLEAVNSMEDLDRKRILGVLLKRQGEAADLLDCVQVKVDSPYTDGGKKSAPFSIAGFLTSPLITMVLSLAALTSSVLVLIAGFSDPPAQPQLQWTLAMMISLVLLLAQSIFSLMHRSQEKPQEQAAPAAEIMLDLNRAKAQLDKRCSEMIIDSQAICQMFEGEKNDAYNAFESDLLKLYPALYEAKVDHPEEEDFNYSLTLVKMMLRKCGMDTVDYSEAQKALFNIEEADYKDQMRYPAIIRKKDETVLKKGEYIKNIN